MKIIVKEINFAGEAWLVFEHLPPPPNEGGTWSKGAKVALCWTLPAAQILARALGEDVPTNNYTVEHVIVT